jgi:hypothetical protein
MHEGKPIQQISSPESIEKIKPLYTALFITDITALTNTFKPRHPKVFGHHSTIAFKPDSIAGIDVGAESKIRIIGRAHDERGDALLVENPKSNNLHPHITLSCAEGTSPFYSNELIVRAIENNTVEFYEPPIEVDVVEGYFDGTNDITSLSK